MTIRIQFSNNAVVAFSEIEKEINKEVINKVIDGFKNESETLQELDLLFYFGWKSERVLGNFRAEILGFTVWKTTPGIERIADEKNDIKDFDSFDCIVYLSSDIGKSESELFKAFTIIHELQHIIQRIHLKNHYQKHFVLNNYYKIMGFDINDLPTEHDAIRKAKLICCNIFGMKNVNLFVKQKITASIGGEKTYWEKIEKINIDEDFDLEDEMKRVWDENIDDIEKNLQIDENLRISYEFYINRVGET